MFLLRALMREFKFRLKVINRTMRKKFELITLEHFHVGYTA